MLKKRAVKKKRHDANDFSDDAIHEYDAKKRKYSVNEVKVKGSHIHEGFDVYFVGDNAKKFKAATEKGINNLLAAANLVGLLKVRCYFLNRQEAEAFLNKIGTSMNQNGATIATILSGYGTRKKAYQVLIGSFDLDGFDEMHIDNALIVNCLDDHKNHELRVSHVAGHMFNAAKGKGRTNVQEMFGTHCFDKKIVTKNEKTKVIHTPCIMRPEFVEEHFDALKKTGAIYCPHCVKDIRDYVKGNS
jgi:hypothetical protein